MACLAVADSAFAYLGATGSYTTGNATNLAWRAGFLLLAVAGAAGREDAFQEKGAVEQLPGWASIWPSSRVISAIGVLQIAEVSLVGCGEHGGIHASPECARISAGSRLSSGRCSPQPNWR